MHAENACGSLNGNSSIAGVAFYSAHFKKCSDMQVTWLKETAPAKKNLHMETKVKRQ
jgi:hypothetical protein